MFLRVQGRLEDARARRLDGLGFVWDPAAQRWQQHITELEAFVEEHGHARVPRGWAPNPSLALWVETVRSRRRRSSAAGQRLTASQEVRLRELGFEFGRQMSWEGRLEQLAGIKARQGHLRGRLPNRGAFEGVWDWVKRQRAAWRAGKLTEQRAAQLEGLGLELDPEEAEWQRGLSLLDAYIQRKGFSVS